MQVRVLENFSLLFVLMFRKVPHSSWIFREGSPQRISPGLQSGAGSVPGGEPPWQRCFLILINLFSIRPYYRHSCHHQVAISPASAQGSVSFTGSSSGRPDLAGLLQGLLQDDGGPPAIEAVVAEEEDYEEEYGEEGEEEEMEGGEVEEDCKSWREGQGVPGETVGRVCLDGEPIVGESKPPVAASTVEEDLEEANQENAVNELADEKETEESCVEQGKANLGHNLMVQHGVPTPRLCALLCQVVTNHYIWCEANSQVLSWHHPP